MNNNSRIDVKGGKFERVGEPTEAALKVLAEKIAGEPLDLNSAFNFEKQQMNKIKTVATLDFSSQRKSMSTIVTGYKNNKDMLMKGAPDRVIEKCTRFMSFEGTREMTAQNKKELLDQVSKLASEGLRCLAIAEIPNAGVLSDITEDNKVQRLGDISKYNEYEQGATFVGVVCIRDPVRPEVKPAI